MEEMSRNLYYLLAGTITAEDTSSNERQFQPAILCLLRFPYNVRFLFKAMIFLWVLTAVLSTEIIFG